MSTTDQSIINKSDLRKWRIELPNLYDDADLDPYEFRLLAHYVRVGNCHESVRTTAKHCHMSHPQVIAKRKILSEKGLIRLGVNEYGNVTIEILDVWAENFKTFSERSCSDQGGQDVERGGQDVEPKKELNKKEPIKNVVVFGDAKTASTTDHQKMVGALAKVCQLDVKLEPKKLGSFSKKLLKSGYTAEQILERYDKEKDWYSYDWRGKKGQHPTLPAILETILMATTGKWNGNQYSLKNNMRQAFKEHLEELHGNNGNGNGNFGKILARLPEPKTDNRSDEGHDQSMGGSVF